jgi:ppGpp synthetase/RelA/SpoT-type nucleotidyltranferase
LLGEVLTAYQDALDVAQTRLEALDLAPSSRVKTVTTLVEKLRRGSSFKSIQDVAGLRVVTEGGRSEQDLVVGHLSEVWPDAKLKDRRIEPMHGYRAVHMIVWESGLPVEIQVRTVLQDTWAQTMERVADRWGRGIRYGDPLEDPDIELAPGFTRADLLNLLDEVSELIAELEYDAKEQDADDVSFSGMSGRLVSILESVLRVVD